jgi:hypothetical protein
MSEYADCVDIFRTFLDQNPEIEGVVALRAMEGDTCDAAHREINYLRRKLGSDVRFDARGATLSSYSLISESSLVLASSSALGLESLGMGVKTLLTSRTFQQAYMSRCESLPPCLLPADQDISPVKYLFNVVAMSSEDYWSKMTPHVSYFMKTPSDLDEIRGLVRELSNASSLD